MEGMELGLGGMEMGLEDSPECFELPIIKGEGGADYSCPSDDHRLIPKGTHLWIKGGMAVYMSFDIKIASKVAGIIQISAEIFWVKIAAGANIGKDCIKEVQRTPAIFNSYVLPWTDIWEQRCINVHQLAPDNERITSANGIETVWQRFNSWFYRKAKATETVILVTWNGESCNLKWLWKITQARGSCCFLPPQIKYFIDPYRVVSYFKSCPMNKTKSKIDSYDVGSVWKFISNANLNGAYNSLIDSKAQTDIFVHKHFVPFIDRACTVQPIDAIFSSTQQNKWKKTMEPDCPVHHPWIEQSTTSNFEWSLLERDSYTGPHGGPPYGPTQFMKDIVHLADNLALVFLAILPMLFFVHVAAMTKKYCYKDWVIEKKRTSNEEGNVKKRTYLSDVAPTTGGEPTPGRKHRADNEPVKWDVNPGFIICWIGLLILQGGHFGLEKRTTRKMWQGSPYGLSIPYVRNSMRRDAFEFLQRHIHFADNNKQKREGEPRYNVLF